MSNQKNLSGSIALTKLKSAFYTTKKGAKCLLIPIDENYLTEKDGAVYMSVGVVVKDEQDTYGQNGFISQKLDSAKYKELGKEKANEIKLPILGNIKDFTPTNNDARAVHEAVIVEGEEQDDLPF
jgi:hypothetical protein